MGALMLAAVLRNTGDQDLDVTDTIEVNDPGPDDVVVKITHTGVCHTRFPRAPSIARAVVGPGELLGRLARRAQQEQVRTSPHLFAPCHAISHLLLPPRRCTWRAILTR